MAGYRACKICSGVTLAFATEDLPAAKAFLRDAQERFIELFSKEGGDAVYQLENAFFPLTHVSKKSRSKPIHEKAQRSELGAPRGGDSEGGRSVRLLLK